MTAGHRRAALCAAMMFAVFLMLGSAAVGALVVMRTAIVIFMAVKMHMMFDVVPGVAWRVMTPALLVRAVMRFVLAIGIMVGVSDMPARSAVTAMRTIGPMMWLMSLGVTAILEGNAAGRTLFAAALLELVLLVRGFLGLGRSDSVVFMDRRAGLAAPGMATAANMSPGFVLGHVMRRVFHVDGLHSHRTPLG